MQVKDLRLVLLAPDAVWEKAFHNAFPDSTVLTGSPAEVLSDPACPADAIVVPSNSFGLMDRGSAAPYLSVLGDEVMTRIQRKLLFDSNGQQVLSSCISVPIGGRTVAVPGKGYRSVLLFHSALTRLDEPNTDPGRIYDACRQALLLAAGENRMCILLPPLAADQDSFTPEVTAALMSMAFRDLLERPYTCDEAYARRIENALKAFAAPRKTYRSRRSGRR